MSGPMGYSDPLPSWQAFVVFFLLLLFVGLPAMMIVFILSAKWLVFVLEGLFA